MAEWPRLQTGQAYQLPGGLWLWVEKTGWTEGAGEVAGQVAAAQTTPPPPARPLTLSPLTLSPREEAFFQTLTHPRRRVEWKQSRLMAKRLVSRALSAAAGCACAAAGCACAAAGCACTAAGCVCTAAGCTCTAAGCACAAGVECTAGCAPPEAFELLPQASGPPRLWRAGAPVPGCWLSVSHTAHYVGVACAPFALGLDICDKADAPRIARIAHRAFTQEEAALCAAAEHPAAEHPAAEHPAAEHPAAEHPAAEHPAAEHLAAEHPAAEHLAAEHPAAEHPAAAHLATEHPAAEHPAAEHPAAEHLAAEHLAAEHPAAEHPAAKRPGVEHLAALWALKEAALKKQGGGVFQPGLRSVQVASLCPPTLAVPRAQVRLYALEAGYVALAF